MSTYYTSPPNREGNAAAVITINNFAAAVTNNRDQLKDVIIKQSYDAASLTGLYIPATVVRRIIDISIIPAITKAEGGWVDHPNDAGGPTMRGVTLDALRSSFKRLFIDTNVPAIKKEALKVYELKAGNNSWLTGKRGSTGFDFGVQVLYSICQDTNVSQFFIYKFLSNEKFGNPIATMAIEPYLGFLLFKFGWASGAGGIKLYKVKEEIRAIDTDNKWTGKVEDIPKLIQHYTNYGLQPVGSPSGGVNSVYAVPEVVDKGFPLALKLLQNKVTWILGNTKPGMRNEPFRQGWLNAAVYAPEKSLLHRIVEMSDVLQSLGLRPAGADMTSYQAKYMVAKSVLYTKTSIEFPNL